MSAKTDRRTFIKGASAALLAANLQACATGPRNGAARPNIVWIVSEDNNPFIGAYGDQVAVTPNIDRLAREGILYEHAYAPSPVCAPTRFAILTGMYAETCSPAQHMRADAHFPEDFATYPEILRRAGYYCTNRVKTDYNCDVDAEAIWNANSNDAHWKNAPEGAPFMAVFNLMTTHESALFRADTLGASPDDIKVPAYLPDTPEMRTEYAKYYGLMTKMDAEVGALVEELELAGHAEDTIVFYYSDNGGVLPRSKRYCFEEGLKCALIVRLPAKWAHLAEEGPGARVERPVSFLDLAPTVIAVAGERVPPNMQGASLFAKDVEKPTFAFGGRNRMDERIDMVRTVTDGRYRYIRNYMPHRPNGQHSAFAWMGAAYQHYEQKYREGALNEVQAMFFKPKVFEELYDLAGDPDQINNRVEDAALSSVLNGLRSALDSHMIAIVDNGFIPEGAEAEGYGNSRNAVLYPLESVMALAGKAASATPGDLDSFTDAITGPNEVLRYWAATGMLILGEAAVPASEQISYSMLNDPSLIVRSVCAEASARYGSNPEAAIAVLGELIDEKHPEPVCLHAINALTCVGPAAAQVLPAIKKAGAGEYRYVGNAGRYLEAVLEGRYEPSVRIFDLEQMLRGMRSVQPQ